MKVTTYACDVCLGVIVNTEGAFLLTRVDDHSPLFTVRPWDRSKLREATGHVCTSTCARKVIGQFLETAKVGVPKPTKLTTDDLMRSFGSIWFRPVDPPNEDDE